MDAGIVELMKAHITAYAKKEGTEEQFALRDLLTDLRHTADAMGLDFEVALAGSLEVYEEENDDPICGACGKSSYWHDPDGKCPNF